MSSGLIVGQVYEKKAADFYAADAGIADGLWQIKHNHLDTLFTSPAYNPYDYTTSWSYDLSQNVNYRDVDVSVTNIWIPVGLSAPSDPDDATLLIEGTSEDPPKMIISGSIPSASTFKVKIEYYPEAGEELRINTLGIWLPPGFTYGPPGWDEATDPDPSNLNGTGIAYNLQIQDHASGQAAIWDFGSGAYFDGSTQVPPEPSFPSVNPADDPITCEVTFPFDGPAGQNPEVVSWVDTNLNLYGGITYTWDADTKVYQLLSEARRGISEPPRAIVEAYTTKSGTRELGTSIAGDYRAIGNSLMTDENSNWGGPKRDTLWAETNATVNDIPDDAEVTAAYLYWSGWFDEGIETTIWSDDCSNFSNWSQPGSDWAISSGSFRGHHQSVAPDSHRYLDMQNSLDLSSYAPGTVNVSWEQSASGSLEDSDRLYFAFSSDGGSTWSANIEAFRNDNPDSPFSYTIPDTYLTDNFRLRFYIDYFGGWGEYCYINNIDIFQSLLAADDTAILKIDGTQVYFDGGGVPQQGVQDITADRTQVINNLSYGNPHGYSYSSFKDVTELVLTFAADPNGNGTYTVGSVDADWDCDDEWAYAGWSLILIYSSAETQGHQLYLYDDFLYKDHDDTFLDFDQDGEEGGIVSGFLVPDPITGEINAAQLTCFVGEGDDYYNGDYLALNGTKLWDGTEAESLNDVWNGQSLGMSADGVDVDTFYVTWASDLLEPGDTSAQIDLWTDVDIWNLVYMIVSFRSETTGGGTITYLIRD
jgi:hypothetical protein